MKNIKRATFILNIRIKRDINRKFIAINQIIYIKKFLHEYKMKNVHSMIIFIDDYLSLTSSDATEARIDQRKYQKRIDNFMYAMITIRPDIAFVIKKLNQFCQNSAIKHCNALDRILRYLKKTIDLILLFDRTAESISYADAIYENDLIDWKFTYENTLFIENGAVIWISKKQRIIVLSTTEAEYVSMCQISKNIVWATRWIKKLDLNQNLNLFIKLFDDNQESSNLIKNSKHHNRIKHIDVQYHYIREMIEDDLIKFVYVPTNEMIADILIKLIKSAIFLHLRKKLDFMKVDF